MRINTSILINKISLCLLFSIILLTPLHEYKKMIVILLLFVLWFISAVVVDNHFFGESLPFVAFLIMFILLDFFRGVILHDTNIILIGINRMPFLIWPLLLKFYYKRVQLLKVPLIFAISLITISGIYTLIGNIAYPEASRLLATGAEYSNSTRDFYQSMNIGGYGLIYGMAFLFMPLILLYRQKPKGKLLIFSIIAFYFVNIMYASFLIAIILSVFLIIFSCINIKRKVSVVIVFGIVFFLVTIFNNEIGYFLVKIANDMNSDILAKRVAQLFSGEYFQEYGDSNRFTIYMNSIKNWLDRPLLGSLQGGTIEYRRSGHSTLLGYLEQYGLIASLYYWYLYRVYITTTVLFNNIQLKNCWFMFYMSFCFLALVNNVDRFGEIGSAVFFIAPTMLLYLDRKTLNKQKSRTD